MASIVEESARKFALRHADGFKQEGIEPAIWMVSMFEKALESIIFTSVGLKTRA